MSSKSQQSDIHEDESRIYCCKINVHNLLAETCYLGIWVSAGKELTLEDI